MLLRADWCETIGDLVRDYDGDVVCSCQVTEELTEADEFGGAFGHCEARAGARLCIGELGAVVCGDGIEDYEADVVAGDGDGELVG